MTDALKMAREAQITAVARALNKRHAEICNVNEADSWMIQGDDFREDARAALAAIDAQQAATVGAEIAALVDAYGAAMADEARTGHKSAAAYARLARSELMDALAATPPAVQALTDERLNAAGLDYALADSFTGKGEWMAQDIADAFKAGARAAERFHKIGAAAQGGEHV